MPMIIYDVPFIGASNKERQYSQKGPTCWYYASKMLFKFHELLNARTDQLYKSWKALSELRKVLTEWSAEDPYLKKLKMGGRYRADAITPLLTRANVSIARDIGNYERDVVALKRKVEELAHEAKPLSGDLRERTTQALFGSIQALDKLRRRTSALNEAIQHVSKLRKECVHGNRFVDLFFYPPAFIPVPIPDGKPQWQRTELELYKVLSNYGPVFAGGDLGWASMTVQGGVLQVSEIGGREAGHAVAVVGVNTHQSKVYYKDPNASQSICIIDFRKFIDKVGLRQVGAELSLFAAVRCNKFDMHGTEYCDHVRLGKKKTAELSRRAREEEEEEWGEWASAEPKAPLMIEWKPEE